MPPAVPLVLTIIVFGAFLALKFSLLQKAATIIASWGGWDDN